VDVNGDGDYKKGAHPGYLYVPCAAQFNHPNFSNTAYSSVGTSTEITRASWANSIPTGLTVPPCVKGYILSITANDSGSFPQQCYVAIGPSSSVWYSGVLRIRGGGYSETTCITVPCGTDGSLWYRLSASGTNTLTVSVQIVGYFI
jgi:hypothetical protein